MKILHDIWDQLDRAAEMHIQPTRQDVDLTPPSFSLKLSQEWRAHFVDLGVIQEARVDGEAAKLVEPKETNDVEQGARVNDETSVDLQSPQKNPDTEDVNKAAEGLVQLVEANNQTDLQLPEQIKDTGIGQVPISEAAEVLPEVLEPNKPIDLAVDIEQGVVIKMAEVSPDNVQR